MKTVDQFRLTFDRLNNKYFLCVFDKTALNEPAWVLVDSSSRKDTLYEKAKSYVKLKENEEYFTFSPDFDFIAVTDPFESGI